MLTWWARRSEDLSFDKNDEKDAVLIARLTSQQRCYVPEPVDGSRSRESYKMSRSRTVASGTALPAYLSLHRPIQHRGGSRTRRGKAGFT
jgi:hypothetical protein